MLLPKKQHLLAVLFDIYTDATAARDLKRAVQAGDKAAEEHLRGLGLNKEELEAAMVAGRAGLEFRRNQNPQTKEAFEGAMQKLVGMLVGSASKPNEEGKGLCNTDAFMESW
jgi:hypothetical protein